MKLRVDKEADALYFRLDDSRIIESQEVSPGVVFDYNESNEAVGVEMHRLSKRSPKLDLSALEFETVEGMPPAPREDRPPFRVRPFHGGFAPGVDPLRLNQLYDQLEVDDFLRRHED